VKLLKRYSGKYRLPSQGYQRVNICWIKLVNTFTHGKQIMKMIGNKHTVLFYIYKIVLFFLKWASSFSFENQKVSIQRSSFCQQV